MQKKIDKAYVLAVIAIVLASISLIITFVANVKVDDGKKEEEISTQTNTYDVSMFNEVSLSDVVSLFDKKGTFLVYLGREDCSACIAFLPTLKNMQIKYNYTTQYLDINKVVSGTSDYDSLMKKLSKVVTLTINGEERTDEYGNFFGYTPMTFIIKDGRFVDGIVGSYSESRFESFLNNNGIK